MDLQQCRFAPGQDASGNDVYVKIVDNDTIELAINRYLLKCYEANNPLAHVLPAVSILSPPYKFSFVVMPL